MACGEQESVLLTRMLYKVTHLGPVGLLVEDIEALVSLHPVTLSERDQSQIPASQLISLALHVRRGD